MTKDVKGDPVPLLTGSPLADALLAHWPGARLDYRRHSLIRSWTSWKSMMPTIPPTAAAIAPTSHVQAKQVLERGPDGRGRLVGELVTLGETLIAEVGIGMWLILAGAVAALVGAGISANAPKS